MRARSSASPFSMKSAWRRLSVQTLHTVISVSQPVASAYARMRAFRWR